MTILGGGLAAVLTAAAAAHAVVPKPRATTVAEICPGVAPDPCVVTSAIPVANGAVLDLEGRALELTPVAALNGDNGGTFSILNAGMLTMAKGSQITAIGRGIAGGEVAITSSGPCLIGGKVLASSARISGIGGAGGRVSLTCNGIDLGGAVEANGVGGGGGQLVVDAGSGPFTSVIGSRLRAGGMGAPGGTLTLTSAASCTLATLIELNAGRTGLVGGPGGTATIACNGITVADTTWIDANGAGDNGDGSTSGGTITLNAGTGPLQMGKGVRVRASGTAAAGGTVAVQGALACVLAGKITVNGVVTGTRGGPGGSATITCQQIRFDRGGVEAIGTLPGPTGGTITLASTGPLHLAKGVTLKAAGIGVPAGIIQVTGGDGCDIAARLQADGKALNGSAPQGGEIQVSCAGPLGLPSGAGVSVNGAPGSRGGLVSLQTLDTLNLAKAVAVVADAKDGVGGQITAASAGDCQLAGRLEALGIGALVSGGSVDVTCGGNLQITPDGDVSAAGIAKGISGHVLLQAAGGMQIDKGARVRNDGAAQIGVSDTLLTAGGVCTIAGRLQTNSEAFAGAPIRIICGAFTLDNAGVLQSTSAGAGAGQIEIDTSGITTGQPPGPCAINGKLRANATSVVERSTAAVFPGTGGAVRMHCGTDLNIADRATIDANGAGLQSLGGLIELSADGGPAVINGTLKTKGSAGGGLVSVVGHNVALSPNSGIDVSAAAAGTIVLRSLQGAAVMGNISIAEDLTARGIGVGSTTGGTIQVEACTITVEQGASLRTDAKQGGTNQLVAHADLIVNGRLSALSTVLINPPGTNLLQYRDNLLIQDLNSITPPAVRIQDLTLAPCTVAP